MTNDDSIKNDALEVLHVLIADVADSKLIVTGYNIARQGHKFVYTIEVEEPFEPPSA